jgi:PAS domain S-box-containing protein
MTDPDEERDHDQNYPDSPGSGPACAERTPKEIIPESLWKTLIIASTAAVLLFSVYCLSHGITIIFMHLYYFPLVLLAYRYRYRGLVPAVLLALVYVALVYFYNAGQPDVITGAWYRFLVFAGIALVVAYLSEQLAAGQNALFESGEKYRAFFSTSMDCVFITSYDGRWVDFNDATVAFFGYGSRRELAAVKISDLYVYPEEREKHIRIISERGYVFEYPVDLKKKDGTVISTLITSVSRKDRECKILGFQGTIRDITDRKRAEERIKIAQQEIREHDRFLQRLIDTIPNPIFYKDKNGIYTGCNVAFESYIGLKRDRLVGKSAYDIAPADLADIYTAADRKLFESPGTQTYESQVKYADGSIHDVIFNKATFTGINGDVDGLVGVILDISERKQAEEVVRNSLALLKGVIESPKDVVIFALDRQYRYIAFNENHRRTMQQIWGADIAIGTRMTEYIRSSEDRNKAVANFDRALAGESFTVTEAYGDTALDRRWYEDIYNPIRDEKGAVIGLTLFLTDITERRHMEEALRESEEKFRGVAERSSDLIMLTDEKGRTTYIAPSVKGILGYDPGEVVGTGPGDIVHPGDLEAVYRLIRKMAGSGTGTEHIEARIRKKDGGYSILDMTVSPVTKDCCFAGLQVIGRDITDRRHAEDALRESRELYRELVENLNDVIFALDLEGKFTYISPAVERLYGYAPDMVLGRHFADFIHPDDHPGCIEAFKKRLKGEYGLNEFRITASDGRVEHVIISQRAVTGEGGKVVGFNYIMTNITARKEAEDALKRSEHRSTTLIRALPDLMFILSRDGVYRDFRVPDPTQLALPSEKIIGSSIRDSGFGNGVVASILSHIRRALETRQLQVFEYELRVPAGLRHYEARLVALSDDEVLGIVRDITDRKRVEEALRASELRFRELFNSMSSGVAVYRAVDNGADFEFVDFNHGAEVIEKIDRQQVIGRRVTEVFPGVHEFGIIEVFRRVWQSGNPEHYPMAQYRDERIASWRENYVYRLPTGEVVAIYDDVTSRRQAEEAVQDSEARLRTLVQTIPDLIWLKDVQGVYLACNPMFERFFGAKESAIVGKTDYDFVDRQLADFFREHDRIAMAAGKPSSNEEWITFVDDGHRALLETIKTPMYGKDGSLIGVLGIGRDITERKKAEEALAESEQKFRDIFNNTTDAIHIHEINPDSTPGRFTDVNEVACLMLGYTREELLAKTPLEITTDYHDPPLEKIFEDQRTLGMARFETEHRKKDGTIIPVEVNTHVVTIQGRNVMLGVVRDMTEHKRAEALLRDFNKELEQQVKSQTEEINASLQEKILLLREIHHRVKNNLQIIISLVNLQMRKIDDEQLRQVMQETQNRVRAMSLVHEKLYQSTDIGRINLADYTRFLATQLFTFYGVNSRHVQLQIDIGQIMLDINTAIPAGLVINELVSNALKHAFPDNRPGLLAIAAHEEGGTIHLTIRDTGVGMQPGFNWRESPSLGFRLVTSLVDQLNGTIEKLPGPEGTGFAIAIRRTG